jgi:hypothetical protein
MDGAASSLIRRTTLHQQTTLSGPATAYSNLNILGAGRTLCIGGSWSSVTVIADCGKRPLARGSSHSLALLGLAATIADRVGVFCIAES